MGLQLPVVWTLHGSTSPGRVDVSSERLTLTSKRRVFSFPLGSIAAYTIERAPARRLRGLPVLVLKLAEGETVLIGSMGGPGSLQELTSAVGRLQLVPSGT